MCKFLSVKRSSYLSFYQLDTTQRDDQLQQEQTLIKETLECLKQSSGISGIKGYLKQAHQVIMSRRKIGRLMKQLKLTVKTTKKFKRSQNASISSPVIAPNLLNRHLM